MLFSSLDEWFIRTAWHCLQRRVLWLELSDSFEVEVGMHQASVISHLLFAVVSGETRSGLPSVLLYAGDLVLMAPTMEQLGRPVADWRDILLDK